MQNKQRIKSRLERSAVKYCYQIGIPWHQLPSLYWNKRDFAKITGRRRKRKGTLGACSYWHNAILVDLDQRNPPNTTETLVHELTHLRWQHLKHGPKFEDRIKEIMKGVTYPKREREDEKPYYRIKLFEMIKGEWVPHRNGGALYSLTSAQFG